ncbi:MAG: amino acid ABC transporter ATP-binding protein [Limnochordaceae bacterium]|nr:amino acid ABC transporter ATP-binding protein [Limnochordaceae bacterium]
MPVAKEAGLNETGLVVSGLTKVYPGRDEPVLDHVDLVVRPGETVVVMGPSGSGKSTLLRAIDRLVEPDAGEIFWNGVAIHRLKGEALRRYRRQVGYVFQQHSLFEQRTVLGNCTLAPCLWGDEPERSRQRAMAALARVGLADLAHRYPRELSGGERQRVAIARALTVNPKLLLWDEPTASLDPILVGEVMGCLLDLANSRSVAMLVVTHEVRFARRVADRLLFLERGRKVEEGPPGQLLEHPRSEVGRRFCQLLAA